MPPKIKITKEEILETAVALIRTNGEKSLNARAIAASLQCSTQPIFSNFATMAELQQATTAFAYTIYLDFLKNEAESGQYPLYKSFGIAYIRFANEEKELFKFLFMRDRRGEDLTPTPDFDASVDIISKANGISQEQAKLMHLEMWTCVHGIAVMLATSFLTLEWDLISTVLSDVYHGIRKTHISEEA